MVLGERSEHHSYRHGIGDAPGRVQRLYFGVKISQNFKYFSKLVLMVVDGLFSVQTCKVMVFRCS